MTRRSRIGSACAATLMFALGGCAVSASAPTQGTAPSALAGYARQVESFDAPTLMSEQGRLAGVDSPIGMLQRALLMAAPRNPVRDAASAAALARTVARSDAEPSLREAGAWVALWIEEQARAEADQNRVDHQMLEAARRIEQMEQRLRDADRRLADADRRSLEAERRGLEAERRALAAERKLDALRLIERDLSSRPAEERR